MNRSIKSIILLTLLTGNFVEAEFSWKSWAPAIAAVVTAGFGGYWLGNRSGAQKEVSKSAIILQKQISESEQKLLAAATKLQEQQAEFQKKSSASKRLFESALTSKIEAAIKLQEQSAESQQNLLATQRFFELAGISKIEAERQRDSAIARAIALSEQKTKLENALQRSDLNLQQKEAQYLVLAHAVEYRNRSLFAVAQRAGARVKTVRPLEDILHSLYPTLMIKDKDATPHFQQKPKVDLSNRPPFK